MDISLANGWAPITALSLRITSGAMYSAALYYAFCFAVYGLCGARNTSMSGALEMHHAPKFERISVKFISHATPGFSQWFLAPGGCGAVTPTDSISG